MAYVMLYGVGWTQRWQVAQEELGSVKAEIGQVGRNEVGHLTILDPGTSEPTTLVVAWQHVAAAVVLGGETTEGAESAGSYR